MDKFRFCLQDRREEPRIRRGSLEGKDLYALTNVMVSTFTERGALKVTLEILRQMNCNEQADTLESKTKACMDKGDPTFPKTSDGKLETKASQEAVIYVASQQQAVKEPKELEAEAKAQISSEGGDLNNKRLVLSRYKIQFGKYKGQTFKWLLENDVGYTAYIAASHQEDRKHTARQDSMMANKDSFTCYANAYPEIQKEVRFHRADKKAKEMSLQSGQRGKALVGFGRYGQETLQSLYRSEDKDKISYVNFLRNKSDYEPGSRMETAIKYILRCDQQRARRTRARRQPNSVSRPTQRNQRTSWRRTSNMPR
ncbi:apoptosis-associated speck-like protein containing a CARD [Scomber scombrus]|uniref:apoptosis-associated speck-like protein containing a CARD n=1 Tax=Scomber scombrus TaxID=13677 RepID=UPI002DDC01B1|nr:apoptosis-associated speck-like protein containing a CARD [Scomber scombrus]